MAGSAPSEIVRVARARGDVVPLVTGLGEEERRAIARELIPVTRKAWRDFDFEPLGGLAIALLACASWAELRKLGHLAMGDDDAMHAVLVDRRPGWLQEWVDWLMDDRPGYFALVRRLVREGLVERPEGEGYVLGLIAFGGRTDEGWLHRALADDPDLLEHGVWRLFDVEGGGENSLAAVDKYGGRWSETLLALAADRTLSRDRLLDASLAALGRDFAAFRAGWFSRLHEALEPTASERSARAGAYLDLLAAPVPATVSFALKALAKVAKAGGLAGVDDLPERLAPALASDRKTTVIAALRLLPHEREDAALAACDALLHEDAAVQAKALDVAETALTDAVRARLADLADAIAPTLRDRFTALTNLKGSDPLLTASTTSGAPASRIGLRFADGGVLDGRAGVEPIADADDLLVVLARIVEGEHSGMDLERALDGVARLGGEDVGERGSGLVQRAREMGGLGGMLAGGWLERLAPDETRSGPYVLELLRPRVEEVAERAARRQTGPLLAFPTHKGGWIDPRVFCKRLAAAPESGGQDLVAALCRLAPDGRDDAEVPDGPHAALVRYALGKDPDAPGNATKALRLAAQLARDLDAAAEPPRVRIARRSWGRFVDVHLPAEAAEVPALRVGTRPSFDAWYGRERTIADAELTALVHPAGHQRFWGHVASELGRDQQFPSVEGDVDAALLAHALDPGRPLGETGALAIAVGLQDVDPEPRAMAVDVAITAIDDGRLDGALLGPPIRMLLEGEIGYPTRLGPSLRAVAAESPFHAQVARAALEHAAAVQPPPRNIHAVLDALNELAADAQAPVALDDARQALAAYKGSSKAAKLAKALLAR